MMSVARIVVEGGGAVGELGWGEPLGRWDPGQIGPYVPLRVLGQGGMGRVYLARGRGARLCAVKVIRSHIADEYGFRARFVREASSARAVSGAFTAPVVDVADPDAEPLWIAAAFIAAPSLDRLVKECGVLPPAAVWWVAGGIAEGLGSVREAGLVHRDLKPGNVLVAADGPRVIDFGIAEALDTVGTASTHLLGSPGYMAPEQIAGVVGHPSDVFALGAVMTYAATGHPPFEGPTPVAALVKTLHEPPDLDGVPAELLDVIGACLAKDPTNRPSLTDLLNRFADRRDGMRDAHTTATWLPADVLAFIQGAAADPPVRRFAPHDRARTSWL